MTNQIQAARDKGWAILYAFAALWHFFFASSFTIRLNPSLFWIGMCAIFGIYALSYRVLFTSTELNLAICLFIGYILLFFSMDFRGSIKNAAYFFIYLGVADMIARTVSGGRIINLILFFCCVHLFCLFLQVIQPGLYESLILPLLPAYAHYDIMYQMENNDSYYGFTVQTSMLGMYLVFGAVVAAVKIKHSRSRTERLRLLILIALCISGILFTTRRGSLLAALLLLLIIYFDSVQSKAAGVAMLVAGAVFLAYFGIENIPGMSGMLDKVTRVSGDVSNGRFDTWSAALESLQPGFFFGFGVGNAQVDNAYLTLLLERGLLGFIVYFAPCIQILISSLKKKKKYKSKVPLEIDFSFYMQLFFFVTGLVESHFTQSLTMFMYYLAVLTEQFIPAESLPEEKKIRRRYMDKKFAEPADREE